MNEKATRIIHHSSFLLLGDAHLSGVFTDIDHHLGRVADSVCTSYTNSKPISIPVSEAQLKLQACHLPKNKSRGSKLYSIVPRSIFRQRMGRCLSLPPRFSRPTRQRNPLAVRPMSFSWSACWVCFSNYCSFAGSARRFAS